MTSLVRLLAAIESGETVQFDNSRPSLLPYRDAMGHAPSLSSFTCGCAHCERDWRDRDAR